jgi:hypothetical protein
MAPHLNLVYKKNPSKRLSATTSIFPTSLQRFETTFSFASTVSKAVAKHSASAALGDVRREEREAQITRDDRNGSLAAWNGKYHGIANALTGLFELAGKQALADRVRPTARRRAGLPENADTETPAGGG